MKPSNFSTSKSRPRKLEAGVDTFARPRSCPLRMRARRSPIGSLIAIAPYPLPARLGHARHLPKIGEVPQSDARHFHLAVVAAGAPRKLAAVVDARGRGVARQLGELQTRGEALFGRDRHIVGPRLQRSPLASI